MFINLKFSEMFFEQHSQKHHYFLLNVTSDSQVTLFHQLGNQMLLLMTSVKFSPVSDGDKLFFWI